MTSRDAPPVPLPFQLSRMLTVLWRPQAIATAAELGIADLLADGPRRSDDLAREAGVDPGALHRLLRALVVLGVCTAAADGTFALTPLGGCLRTGTLDSIRSWARLWGRARMWQSWARFGDCVRTGQSVPAQNGRDPFDEFRDDPETREIFNQSMLELTRHIARAVTVSYDFSELRTLVDVGGGYGQLLVPILQRHPRLKGTVYDLPHCREGALRVMGEAGLADQFEFVGGSFFEAVPEGADAYIVKSVIHDWDDVKSTDILRACRAAMRPGARLLVCEPIASDVAGSSPIDEMIAASDLNMLVVTGGRERTEREFRDLLDGAGLPVTRIVPTPAAFSLIESRRI